MHAVSSIAAIILILIIAVSLSSLVYVLLSKSFTSIKSSTEQSMNTETTNLLSKIQIKSMSINSIYVKNVGSVNLKNFSVYVNGVSANFNVTPDIISPGQEGTITINDFIRGDDLIKVTTAQGVESSIKAPDPGSKAVAYWNFDEGSGTTATDSSPYGNNGVFSGETFNDGTIYGVTRVSGIYGNALSFNGANNYVNVPHKNSLNLGNQFTIEAWFNTSSNAAQQWIISKHVPNSAIYSIYMCSGYVSGWIRDAAGVNLINCGINQTANTYNDGKWHHVAVVRNGATATVYMDGGKEIITATNPTVGSADSTADLWVGGLTTTGIYFNGTIDEVRIYNRSLSLAEIQADMQSSSPISRTVASYSFEEPFAATYVNDTHIWVQGKYGKALSFDGVNDYVSVPDSNSLHFELNSFTITFWFNLISPNSFDTTWWDAFLWSKRTGNRWNNIKVYNTTGGFGNMLVSAELHDDSNNYYAPTGPFYVNSNTWYFVAYTVDRQSNQARIWLNGQSGSPINIISLGNLTNTINMQINDNHFNGIIDEVRIYNQSIY